MINNGDTLICGTIEKVREVTKGLEHEKELSIENNILKTKIDTLTELTRKDSLDILSLEKDLKLSEEQFAKKEKQNGVLQQKIDIHLEREKSYKNRGTRNAILGGTIGTAIGIIIATLL